MSTEEEAEADVMPQNWKDLLEELVPRQGNWSEDEYLVLTDQTKRPVELTDGFLEALPWPTDRHQSILQVLFREFVDFVKASGGCVRFLGLRMQIRKGKFRTPDLLLLRSDQDPRRQNRFWTGADLVVEVVSPENSERDLVHKRMDYAEARIPEYWIVNPL